MSDEVKQAPAEGVAGVVGDSRQPAAAVAEDSKKKKKGKHKGPELKDSDGRPIMQIKIYSPFKNFFDEPAYSITALNKTGTFDVLPRHHNFMSLIDACDMVIQAPSGEKTIRVNRAVMHVKYDQVVIFVDA